MYSMHFTYKQIIPPDTIYGTSYMQVVADEKPQGSLGMYDWCKS